MIAICLVYNLVVFSLYMRYGASRSRGGEGGGREEGENWSGEKDYTEHNRNVYRVLGQSIQYMYIKTGISFKIIAQLKRTILDF